MDRYNTKFEIKRNNNSGSQKSIINNMHDDKYVKVEEETLMYSDSKVSFNK